ncbi:MAG: hypothetical protein U5L09_17860 [Bacteroidales bacterium]|nr:hypothetical protein [Bacteroidales bacterium]
MDLGQVGDLIKIDATLLEALLKKDFLPVVASVAHGPEGADYNVNGPRCPPVFWPESCRQINSCRLPNVDGSDGRP